jgi:hypothetical protein
MSIRNATWSRAVSLAVPALAGLALAGLGGGAVAAATAAAPSASAPAAPATACGARAGEVLATAAGTVAERIYAAEVKSSEVLSDRRQIEGDGPLLSAVASGNGAAIEAAVHTLVYSHTHIVRLRVSRGSTLLADDGGPYILAPVSGSLRSHGKLIGHFVFSVQDDLGYVKLVARFIGAPLVLRTDAGQVPVEGLLSPGPATIPDRGPVSYRGASYEAYSFRAEAYPSGRLRVSLLLGVSGSLEAKTCARIDTDELGVVAERISRRFKLSRAALPSYVKLVHTLTHALVYVRSGARTVAGSSHDAPARLPASGALRFHGVDYEVASFTAPAAPGSVRVYVLVARQPR